MDVEYIEFLHPGGIFSESSQIKVTEPVHAIVEKARAGNIFGYRTYIRSESVLDGETLVGNPRQYSPWTFFGHKMDIKEVEERMPKSKILLSNMRNSPLIVYTEYGQCIPMNKDDVVVEIPVTIVDRG